MDKFDIIAKYEVFISDLEIDRDKEPDNILFVETCLILRAHYLSIITGEPIFTKLAYDYISKNRNKYKINKN